MYSIGTNYGYKRVGKSDEYFVRSLDDVVATELALLTLAQISGPSGSRHDKVAARERADPQADPIRFNE